MKRGKRVRGKSLRSGKRPMVLAFFLMVMVLNTSLYKVHAQEVSDPTAEIRANLCGAFPQTFALPDLVLSEVNADDFKSGTTTFILTVNASDVSWNLDGLIVNHNGTSQSFASSPVINGSNVEVPIDLATNTTRETLTLSGLQLIFNAWDFSNNSPSINITIEDPGTGATYSFQQSSISAYAIDVINAALTAPGTTQVVDGASGTYVYCEGSVTPVLEVDANVYEDSALGNPQWQWQFKAGNGWVDIATATDATYQPLSLLQNQIFRRKTIGLGDCEVQSTELLIKFLDYLPGTISFLDTGALTDYAVCDDTSVTIFNETSASTTANGAVINYEWYVVDSGGSETLIAGAINPYYTITDTSIYPDGTQFIRRTYVELDGFVCDISGKDTPALTLNKITVVGDTAVGPNGSGSYQGCSGEVVDLQTNGDPANGLAATYTWERLQSSGAWLSVANGETYTFNLLQGTATYRRRTTLANSNCSVVSEPIAVTGYGISPGQIQLDSGETVLQICEGAALPIVRGVLDALIAPSSILVPISYTWEISTDDGTGWSAFTEILGTSGSDLTLGFSVTQRTRIRRRASIETANITCQPDTGLSNVVEIDVVAGLAGGSAVVSGYSTSDYVVCEGEAPLGLEVTNASQPDPAGSLGYRWERQWEGFTGWIPVLTNGTGPTLSLDTRSGSASYRRITYVVNGDCEVASEPVSIWFNAYDAGQISWADNALQDTITICSDQNFPIPVSLQDGSAPNYPGAGLLWLWQYSEDEGATWSAIGVKGPDPILQGLPSNTADQLVFRRLSFSQWTIGGQTWECVPEGKASNMLYWERKPVIDGGSIDSAVLDQSLCNTSDLPVAINVTDTNNTAALPLAYQWERYDVTNDDWIALFGETGASLVFTDNNRPFTTTSYRRATYLRDTDLGNICVSYTDNVAEVQVFTLDAGQVAISDSFVCFEETATIFDVSSPISVPDQNFTLSWEVTTDPVFTIDPLDVNWTPIAQNQLELQTDPFLDTQETTYYYRRVVDAEFCDVQYSNIITVQVLPEVEAGTTVAENQNICLGDTPGQLSVTVSAPLSGNLSYQWFQRTDTAVPYVAIPQAQGATFSPGVLATTTYFYREAYFSQNNTCAASSSELELRVYDLDPGVVSGTQTLCEGATDISLGSVQEATEYYGGTITYQWQQTRTVNNQNSWVNVSEPTANNAVLTVSQVPAADIHYRRMATVDGLGCTDYSNVVTIQVITHTGDPDIQFVGFSGNSLVFCSGTLPPISGVESLQSSAQQITYRWYESGNSTDWNLIPGAIASSYQPSVAMGQYVYYKREVVLISNGVSCVLESNVLEVGPGNPNVIVDARGISATDDLGMDAGSEVLVCTGGTPNTFLGEDSVIFYDGTPDPSIDFTYQWYRSTDGILFTPIPGGTDRDYTESTALSQTTYYWRLTSPSYDGETCSAWSSNRITVLVPETGSVDIRSNSRVICPGDAVQTLVSTRTIPQTELNTMSFQWWQLTGGGSWAPITGAVGQSYTPQGLTETTSFKRVTAYDVDGDDVTDCDGDIESNVWTIRVNTVDPGRITYNGTMVDASTVEICYGAQPELLITDGSDPYAVSGTQAFFNWEVSSNGINWTDEGSNTEDFQAPELQQDTWYRRQVGSLDSSGLLCWSDASDENIIRFQVLPEVAVPVLVDNIGLACSNDLSAGFLQIDNYNTDPNLTYLWERSHDLVVWNQVTDDNGVFGGEVWNVPQLFETTYYRVEVVPTGFSEACAQTSNIVEIPVVDIDPGYLRFLNGDTSDHYQATCALIETDILIGSNQGEAPSAPGFENTYEVFWESRPYGTSSDWTEIDFNTITANPISNTLQIYGALQNSRYFRRGVRVPTSNGSFCIAYSNPVLVEVMESPQIGILDTQPYITNVLCPGASNGSIILSGTGAISGGISSETQQQVRIDLSGTVAVGDILTINVNGAAFIVTASLGNDLTDLAEAFVNLINNGQTAVTATAQQTSIIVSADLAGRSFSVGTLVQTDRNIRMDVTYLQANHPGLLYQWIQLANGIPVNGFVDSGTLDLTNVPAGEYQLTVTNLIDCTRQTTPVFTITEPEPLPGDIQRAEGNMACVGENILLTVTGDSNYDNQGYQWEYSTDGGTTFDPIQISGVDAQAQDLLFPNIQTTTFFRRTLYLTDAYGEICVGGVPTPPYQITLLQPSVGSIVANEPVVCVNSVPDAIVSDPSVSPVSGNITYYYWESTQDLVSGSPVWTLVQGASLETLTFNAPLGASTRFRRFAVAVQDGVQCVSLPSNEVTITLEDSPVIDTASIQANGVLDVSCHGAMDASITLANGDILFPLDGPDPDTSSYRWVNLDDPTYMATTASITNLGPGRYQLELTYSRCIVLSNYVIVEEPQPFGMDVQASCNGTLETDASGGSGTYEYTLEHPNGFVERLIGFAGHVFPNLIPGGTYTLTVDDLGDRSCPPISQVTTIPLGLVLNEQTIQTQPVSCYGAADGSIWMNVGDVTIQGGTAPFAITWVSPSGATFISENPSQLEAGTYVLTVTDQLGCSASTAVTVQSTDLLEIAQSQVINQELSCTGDQDGTIGILVQADPDRPYQIDWYKNNTSYASNTTEINGLGAGVYRVEVYYIANSDGNCRVTQEFEVREPEPFTSNLISIQDIGCDATLGGSVTISAQGGTLPYRIRLDGGDFQNFNATEFTLTGVPAGSHQITVTDSNGCDAGTFTVSLTANDPLRVEHLSETDQQPINCDKAGSLSIRVAGGAPPYFYEWTGPSYAVSGPDFSTIFGLTLPGMYSVTVTDANQCQSELVTMILEDVTQGFDFDAVLGDINCLGPNNPTSIILNIGTEIVAPYTILWEAWQLLDPRDTTCTMDCYGWVRVPEADGAVTYANAIPGNYRITITDGSLGGCNIHERYVTVPEGLLRIVDPVLTLPECNVAYGQLYFGVEHINPIAIYLNGNPLDTSNAILSYDTLNDRYSLNNLPSGDYFLEARDLTTGLDICSAIYSFTVEEYSPITYTGESSFTLDVCENAPVFSLPSTSISGGNPFYGAGGGTYYNLKWTGPNNFGMSGVSSIPVTEGKYQLLISDASGCVSEPIVFSFTNNFESIRVASNVVQPGCGNSGTGSISIEIEGGKPIYDILWEREVVDVNGAVNYEEIGRAYTAINDLEAGRFRLTVLSDLPNCLNDNPARRYMKTFALGGVESLGLVEGPSLSADLCDGGPGIVTLKLFDNTGSTEGDLTFYYNGNLVVSSYKGNGDYEVYIDQPVDNASLYMVNVLGCELIEELTLGVPVAAFAYSSPNFDSSGTLFEQEEITFTNQANGDFALAVWNFGDGTEVRVDPATDPAEIIHTYELSGTYEVSLEVFNDSGCSRRYSESLAVGLGYQILFPNAFTPNGDGINEYFEGEFTGIESFELNIYNTWGGLITTIAYAHAEKPLHWGWDGNYADGSLYTQKYFRYVFTAITIKGEEVTRAGEAVILR